MQQLTPQEQHQLEQFCRTTACLLITSQALDIWSTKTEQQARRMRHEYKQEIKQALSSIEKACKAISFNMQALTQWALDAAITEDGHRNDLYSYDALQNDAGLVASLSAYTFNATHDNPDALCVIESYCKAQTKQPLIDYDFIESLKPKM